MKKTLLTFLSAATSFALVGQPVLNRANYFTAGQSFQVYSVAMQSPGNSGADQAWDFSNLTTTLGGTYSAVNNVPLPSGFEATNLVIKIELGTSTLYEFQKVSDTKSEVLQDQSGRSYLHDPKINVVFPFSYNLEVTDSWMRDDHIMGNALRKYDAYGTLKTPFGTYANAFRLKTSSGGMPDTYTWYAIINEKLNPLISIDQESNKTLIFKSTSVTGLEAENIQTTAAVYPSPAVDNISFISSATISFAQMVDTQGKIYSCEVKNNSTNISQLQTGIYTAILYFEDGTSANSRFVISR